MISNILHIGLTITNMEQSIKFYKDILGLKFIGEIFMESKETDILFARENCKAHISYLNGSDDIISPPIELIQFVNDDAEQDICSLHKTSISEVCFKVDNIDTMYRHLLDNNVKCLSSPQLFDFTKYGFGKSKALYFKDPDGIILELIEEL